MLRLYYVIIISFPLVIYYLFKARYVAKHLDKYSEERRYEIAQRIVRIMKRNGRIDTDVFGLDNLPKEGGYVMYSNHQGRYDALGIIFAHKRPCSFVIDEKRSRTILANEFTMMLEGVRLDKTNLKAQVKAILEVAKRVKDGHRYIIFPEGRYDDNKNTLYDFLPGAFNCSIKSKAPIIPVALKDSYKPFGINSLKKVHTEVHFLEPLFFEDYKGLTSIEIAEHVKKKIQAVLDSNNKEEVICG